jgi:hypothetical protein
MREDPYLTLRGNGQGGAHSPWISDHRPWTDPRPDES